METQKKAYSVKELCQKLGISRGLFYKMVKAGNGPRMMRLGRRNLISIEATQDWQKILEATGRKSLPNIK